MPISVLAFLAPVVGFMPAPKVEQPKIPADAPVPYSLESLIAWLRTMPADDTYRWEAVDGTCLIGQYSSAHGDHDTFSEQIERFNSLAGYCYPYNAGIRSSVAGHIAVALPHTFGDALARAIRVRDGAWT